MAQSHATIGTISRRRFNHILAWLMSVLTDALRWTCLIRDLYSGRGFCCCKLAFPRSLLNCQLFSPGSRHFSPHIKKAHICLNEAKSIRKRLAPSFGEEELGQHTLFTLSELCDIYVLDLNRCNWISSILSSTGALSLHRDREDNSLTVLVQMGPPLRINENSALSDNAFTDPFNQLSSLKWVIKVHYNSRHDLLCCCWSKRNSSADARKHGI